MLLFYRIWPYRNGGSFAGEWECLYEENAKFGGLDEDECAFTRYPQNREMHQFGWSDPLRATFLTLQGHQDHLFQVFEDEPGSTVRKSVSRCDAAYRCPLIFGSTRLRSHRRGSCEVAPGAIDLSQLRLRRIFIGCRIRRHP
jgi:hypothetical protein